MNKLSKIFTSAGFEEDEVKLDAPNKEYLNDVWSLFLTNPHYARANSSYLTNGHPDTIDWDSRDIFKADPAQSTSKWRYRYYFDTPDLALFKKGIELRLQPEKGGAFKQVIKFNSTVTQESIVLQRLEFPALLRRFEPDIRAIDKKAQFRNEAIEIFHDTIGHEPLAPKVAIRSQRRKMEYHPGDDRRIMIEAALDIGTCMNIAGFDSPLCQAELESKKNETVMPTIDILTGEAMRLKNNFSELAITTRTKPSDAMHDLETRIGTKKARNVILELPRNQFVLTGNLPVLVAP